MSLTLTHLDDRTRQYMLDEVNRDISNNALYYGKHLSPTGEQDYPRLLVEAVTHHDDSWLADNINLGGRLNTTYEKKKPKGGMTTAHVPSNAHEMLAEGEFNRFYIRGLCRRAIDDGIPDLIVYRAKAVVSPRSESQAKIGMAVNAQALLTDLQSHQGVDTALGLPPGPGSGLSVTLP